MWEIEKYIYHVLVIGRGEVGVERVNHVLGGEAPDDGGLIQHPHPRRPVTAAYNKELSELQKISFENIKQNKKPKNWEKKKKN